MRFNIKVKWSDRRESKLLIVSMTFRCYQIKTLTGVLLCHWVQSTYGMTVESKLDVLPFECGDNQHIYILEY